MKHVAEPEGVRKAQLPREISMPVGIVIRRTPSSSRWVDWHWKTSALLPGAAPAHWRVLRSEGETVEYHAATLPLELHRSETEAYRMALSSDPPTAYVILTPDDEAEGEFAHRLRLVTASPFEAQDCLDSGEELVEPVPMPAGLVAWIQEFVEAHHVDEPFRKRRRDEVDTGRVEEGKGDPRIRQASDVYRAPGARRRES